MKIIRESDPDEANTNDFNPLVPRAIDLPTTLPAAGRIAPEIGDIAKIFAAPEDPREWPAWREALAAWREEARGRLGYSGRAYSEPDTQWASRCYSVALLWLWDERLFDHVHQRFTVSDFLASTAGYGGFDGVVLWHAYPVIGIDDRNQFDFYRQVPGINELIAEFQRHGVRVFINYNPWDTGTRRTGRDDPAELAAIVGELKVDGVFLDTMKEGGKDLIDALRGADPRQVLEGESRVQLTRIEDHQLSWAQWFADSTAPGVFRAHWYERRHMLHSTRRWNRDHSSELQSSFMNGTGMLVWDTVFGVWVGWNERDRSTLQSMLRVQRALSDVFINGQWDPLMNTAEEAVAAGVYASRFEHNGVTLWTLVNRGETDYAGPVLEPGACARAAGAVDGGEEPGPVCLADLLGGHLLSGSGAAVNVPARGIAAVLGFSGARPEWLDEFLAVSGGTESAVATQFPAREASLLRPAPASVPAAPERSVELVSGEREVSVHYRRRETGLYAEAPYVEEWKPLPPRLHDAQQRVFTVEIGPVAVSTAEVTNGEYAAFLQASGYRPACSNRFLAAFDGAVPGAGAGPVTFVSLADARAYAAWRGARLPTEFEWQAAAGDSAFERLEPMVWNWTESEHSDGITRFVLLKGGSSYAATGSDWYFDGGVREPEFSAKFLLPGLGLERSANIGFRLAWDVEEGQPLD